MPRSKRPRRASRHRSKVLLGGLAAALLLFAGVVYLFLAILNHPSPPQAERAKTPVELAGEKGFNLGHEWGGEAADRALPVPTAAQLGDVASQARAKAGIADPQASRNFESEFKTGYEVGYKERTKKAF